MTTLTTAFRPAAADGAWCAAIADLEQEALAHPGAAPALLARFAGGGCAEPDLVVRTVAWHWHGWVAAYELALRRVLARLAPAHRAPWQRRLAQVQGQLDADDCTALRRVGIAPATAAAPHAALFRRFAHALGWSDAELAQRSPPAHHWCLQTQRLLDSATPAEAFGALALGVERVEGAGHRLLMRGLLELGTLRRDDLVFFDVHAVDEAARLQTLRAVAADLAAERGGTAELRTGMRAALQLRCEFWDRLGEGR